MQRSAYAFVIIAWRSDVCASDLSACRSAEGLGLDPRCGPCLPVGGGDADADHRLVLSARRTQIHALRRHVDILYFAWVREKIGKDSETVTLPGGVTDVAALIRWLSSLSDGHAEALAEPRKLRVAVEIGRAHV